MNGKAKQLYEFGPFRLDPVERILLRGGEPVRLAPKAFDTLLILVESGGRTVEKQYLLDKVWPDTFVEEGNLKVTIFMLRKALEEGGESSKYIETIPKRGYRFAASVRQLSSEDVEPVRGARGATTGIKSIAILPFRFLGAKVDDEYLGLGLADALITRISNLRQVVIRPTSAILKYCGKEQAPTAAGREMKVDAVLEGGIRKAGQRMRVTVQLVNVGDGAPIWAEKFDEAFTDIFMVEDSISAQVAKALTDKLTGEEKKLLAKRYTENTEAYHLYLKGRYYWTKRTSAGLKKGIEYFQQAIDIDPTYALALSGLADCYAQLSWIRNIAPGEAFPRAKAAAVRALEIDDDLAEAHTSMAWIRMLYDWEWAEAERGFNRSIELNQNYATSHLWYTVYLIATARSDEAILEIRRAQNIDPLSPIINTIAGWPFYFRQQFDRAIALYQKALEIEPNFFPAHLLLGYAYEQAGDLAAAREAFQKARLLDETAFTRAEMGRIYAVSGEKDKAEKVIAELKELSKTGYVSPQDVAEIYVGLGEVDLAFEWLEKAISDRSSWLIFLGVEPRLDSLRSDPRFKNLLGRMGLSAWFS